MRQNFGTRVLLTFILLCFSWPILAVPFDLNGSNYADLPVYQRIMLDDKAKFINISGSTTMAPWLKAVSAAFSGIYPFVKINLSLDGSNTAPYAFIQNQIDLAAMSRRFHADEIQNFKARWGNMAPTELIVAGDIVAIYANRQSPVSSLHLRQVDAIFSESRRCGSAVDLRTFGQLGFTQREWNDQTVMPMSRDKKSGTRTYFENVLMCKGIFKIDETHFYAKEATLLDFLQETVTGFGYGSLSATHDGVKTLLLSRDPGRPAYEATLENALDNGKYPLSRDLYFYVNLNKSEGLDPVLKEFLLFALSKESQAIALRLGYIPLRTNLVTLQRSRLP